MKIYLHEITELGTELEFTQDEPWVAAAVERVDETTDEDDGLQAIQGLRVDATPRPGKQARPVQVSFNLSQVDEVVVLRGHIETYVTLVCSRCANPFHLNCRPDFSGLFCKDPVMAGVAHLGEDKRPSGKNNGYARHAHDMSSDVLQSEGKDLDITYLANDYVDLGDVLTEHLQLQIPFQPLCRADCKGMCTQCGSDLNTGRCACAKIANSHPFSVLKDLNLK
jgi:uncharacterized metal-binding protein YceD (DUF177 family)